MYYRGEPKDYNETSCIPSIFRQSGYNVIMEKDYLESLIEDFSGIAIFDTVKRDAERYEYYYLKILGVLQHYGFVTRLLDITTDRNISLYFASSKHFNEAGKLFEFDEKELKEIRTPSADSILRKIQCIRKADYYTKRSVWEELDIPKNERYTITNNLVVDYNMVLKDVIGTSKDNIRINKQKGAFILFGNVPDDNGRLTGNYKPLKPSRCTIINPETKFENLISLATNEHICSVTVYPDSDANMKIIEKYRYLSVLKDDKEIFEKACERFIDDLKLKESIIDSVIKRMKNDMYRIMKCRYLFYLLGIEYVEYCKDIKNKKYQIRMYDEIIKAGDNYLE